MASPRRIRTKPEKCTGCRVCELICGFTKHGEFNPRRSRIRVVKMERFLVDIPVVCRFCLKPVCVSSCPADALRQDHQHVIHVDQKLCTGCELCIEACPFGAISMDPTDSSALVCDLCQGSPQCVQWCPTGALEIPPANSGAQKKRWTAVTPTARSLLRKWGIPLEEFEKYYGPASPEKARVENFPSGKSATREATP
ncbi:MAG: 4Fe-4S dicluster domain-containing protein [Desulfobacterales bacterium]|nr:4Fe-4S dicluster domain-containing protein [Desulfobacterales bacterium]